MANGSEEATRPDSSEGAVRLHSLEEATRPDNSDKVADLDRRPSVRIGASLSEISSENSEMIRRLAKRYLRLWRWQPRRRRNNQDC